MSLNLGSRTSVLPKSACQVAESGAGESGSGSVSKDPTPSTRIVNFVLAIVAGQSANAGKFAPVRSRLPAPSVRRRGDTKIVTRQRSPLSCNPFGRAVKTADSVAIVFPHSSLNAWQ